MSSNEILAIMVLTGGILGIVGFVVSCICVSMIAGFCRSTHTVQYVPHEELVSEDKTLEQVMAENEQALLDKVGKKKKDQPTVVEDLDNPIEEITKTDIQF